MNKTADLLYSYSFPQASALWYFPIIAILLLERVVYTGCVSLPNSQLFLNFCNLTSYHHTVGFPLLVTNYLPSIFVPFLLILLDFLLHVILLTTGADTLENLFVWLSQHHSVLILPSFSDPFSFHSNFSYYSISITSDFSPSYIHVLPLFSYTASSVSLF